MVEQGIEYIDLMFGPKKDLMFRIKYVGWMERNIFYKYDFSTLIMKDDVD